MAGEESVVNVGFTVSPNEIPAALTASAQAVGPVVQALQNLRANQQDMASAADLTLAALRNQNATVEEAAQILQGQLGVSYKQAIEYINQWQEAHVRTQETEQAAAKSFKDEVDAAFALNKELAAQYAARQQQSQSTEQAATSSEEAAASAGKEQAAWKTYAEELAKMGATAKEIATALKELTVSESDVTAKLREMADAGLIAATGFTTLSKAEMDAAAQARGFTSAAEELQAENRKWSDLARQQSDELRAFNKAEQDAANGGVSLFETMRGGRLVIAGVLADMALAHIAMGQQLPDDLQILVKGFQTTIDMATGTAFAFEAFLGSESLLGASAGPVGLLVGAIGGAMIALATNAAAGDQSLKDVNKTLDDLASKSQTKQMLADLVNLTDAEAQKAQQDAQQNANLAKALDDRAKAQERVNNLKQPIPFFGRGVGEVQTEQQQGTAESLDPQVIRDAAQAQLNLTQSQLDGAVAAQKEFDANKALHDELLRDAESSASSRLSNLSGATADATKQFLSFAATHQDVAKTAQGLTDQINQLKADEANLAAQHALSANMAESYNTAIGGLQGRLRQLISSTNELDDAEKQRAELVKALPDNLQKIVDAQQQLIEEQSRISDQAKQFAKQEADAWQNAMQSKVQAEQQAAEQIKSIQQQEANQELQLANSIRGLNEGLNKDLQSLRDKQADIQRSYLDKQADQYFSYQQQVENLQRQEVDRQHTLADTLYNIEFDLQQRIEAIRFQEGQSEKMAKTYAQVLDIREKANFEVQQAQEKAAHEIAIDKDKNQQAISDDAFKLQQLEENYQHELEVDKRTRQEELDNAKRAYDEQVAAQKLASQNQINDIIARIAIEGGYVTRSGDTFKVVEQAKLDDVQKKLTQQEAAIRQRYDQEMASIRDAKDKFVDAENVKIAKLDETIAKLQQQIDLAEQAGSLAPINTMLASPYASMHPQPQGTAPLYNMVTAPFNVTVQGNIIGMDQFQSMIKGYFDQFMSNWMKNLAP